MVSGGVLDERRMDLARQGLEDENRCTRNPQLTEGWGTWFGSWLRDGLGYHRRGRNNNDEYKRQNKLGEKKKKGGGLRILGECTLVLNEMQRNLGLVR